MTLDDLKSHHGALLAARYAGVRSVSYDGRQITYGSDVELAAAIADIERRIASFERGAGRIVRPHTAEWRDQVELVWPDADSLLSAMIDGGPVALAAKRFAPEVRAEVEAAFLGSVAAFLCHDWSYAIPAERRVGAMIDARF